jgi:hypothetical protein
LISSSFAFAFAFAFVCLCVCVLWDRAAFHDIPNPQAAVDYNGTKLALALFLRSPQHATSSSSSSSSGMPSSTGSSGHGGVLELDDDPSHEDHEITRWFGQHNFLLFCPVGIHRMEDDGTFRAIFSALSVALCNMQFPLPCFVSMTKPERLHTTPLVLGYAAPVPPRRHTLQFQSVTVQGVHPRHELYYLDGLFRHFELQLQSLIGEPTDADRAAFTATVVEFYNIARPYWASVRGVGAVHLKGGIGAGVHGFHSQLHCCWQAAASEDSEEDVSTHQPLIDAFLQELWFCAPEVEYSGSVDTLQEMRVEIWYKGLKRGAVVDNEYVLPIRRCDQCLSLRLTWRAFVRFFCVFCSLLFQVLLDAATIQSATSWVEVAGDVRRLHHASRLLVHFVDAADAVGRLHPRQSGQARPHHY